MTLREIATAVDASLSSVSVWVRDVQVPSPPLPPRTSQATDPQATLFEASSPGVKTCSRCARTLPIESFSRDRGGHQKWCKSCWHAYTRANRDSMRRSADARRARARQLVKQVKQHGACTDCGLRDADCMEFDHVGEKTGDIGALVASRIGVERLAEELSRCELVCACCHRRRTVARRPSRPPSRFDRGRQRNQRLTRTWASLLGCADCGERDPDVLEYDHTQDKAANVAQLSAHGVRVGRLFDEMLKCEIRCANCHRRRHAIEYRLAAAQAPAA